MAVASITKVTMTGSEVTYTIPDTIHQISFRPRANEAYLRFTAGGDYWTIAAGGVLTLTGRDYANVGITLQGTNLDVVEVLIEDRL